MKDLRQSIECAKELLRAKERGEEILETSKEGCRDRDMVSDHSRGEFWDDMTTENPLLEIMLYVL